MHFFVRNGARTVLRTAGPRPLQQRAASSTSQEQLSSFGAKAQQAIAPATKRVEGLLGSYGESIAYNFRVAGAVLKQVYIAEALAPPKSFSVVTDAYRTLARYVTEPALFRSLIETGAWKKAAVYGAEAWGIFTIGEIIGRRSIVGYKLDLPHGGHGHH